jgi:carboxypeptidase Q
MSSYTNAFKDMISLTAATLTAAVVWGCRQTNDGAQPTMSPRAAVPEASSSTALLDAAMASHGAAQIVQSLTDEVGPRLAGSPAGSAAVDWAVRTLRERGLANVHTEPVSVPHWQRGEDKGAVVSPVVQPLQLTALGGSIGTPAEGIEAEVVESSSLEALSTLARTDVAGKIVFFNVPTARTRDGSGYGKAVSVRWLGAVRAAELGALAVVIRSIGTDSNRLPHTGGMKREDKVPAVPAAALAIPDAELLHRLLAEHKKVKLQLKIGCRSFPNVESANVVGEIPGAASPDEIILLGAHLDSWDLGTGALDDGAGVGIVVNAAQLIGSLAHRPRRTIRVVLFANEENGLAGGRAYAQAHRAEASKHIAAYEADSGTGRAYALRYVGAPEARASLGTISAALKPLGIELVKDDAHGGADLSPLRDLGVPVVDLAQDFTTYFDFHHTANDTFDKIDPEALAQVSAATAVLADALANMGGDLGRAPPEKRDYFPKTK